MTGLSRRFAVFGILLLLIVIAMGGVRRPDHGVPRLSAAGSESFTQTTPTKLLAGVPSHHTSPGGAALPADADPTDGLTGYCIAVVNEGHAGTGGNAGFTVTNASILSTSVFTNGSATNTDDVYCAVIQPTLQATSARPPVVLSWTYTESPQPVTITLTIPEVTVRLIGTDGVVGGSAQVCTEGWDGTFLTGGASNSPQLTPNPLDIMSVNDWTVPIGVTKTGVFRAPGTNEWCVGLSSPVVVASIDVSLSFWGLYDTNVTTDDVLTSVSGPGVVKIVTATAAELRHIIGADDPANASLIPGQVTTTNVIGAVHAACIIPSVAGDTLDAKDIQFISGTGAIGNVLAILHVPAVGGFQGVSPGTLCFTWTSPATGSQAVTLQFTASTANPLNTSGAPKILTATWDTNGDGNDGSGQPGGLLLKDWAQIDHTVITSGGDISQNIVTGGTTQLAVRLNVADGAFLGSLGLTEWVVGVRPNPIKGKPAIVEPIDGVPVTLTIDGGCGYFVTNPPSFGLRTIQAVTQGGRVQFSLKVDNDRGCTPGSMIIVHAQARYPSAIPTVPLPDEIVGIRLQYTAGQIQAPLVEWVGSTATITYAFSGQCPGAVAVFLRRKGQPGTFSFGASGGDSVGNVVRVPVTSATSCTATITYESEDEGEVDIIAQLDCSLCDFLSQLPPADAKIAAERLAANSKVVFPLYFLEFEDLSLSVEPQLTVSQRGNLDATVRGWFLGSNPSPRVAEKKADGRTVPATRWVLPDDWATLKGPENFRPQWPGAPDMPSAKVTFFMENEDTVNSYPGAVKDGAAGFFLQDELPVESDFNVNPATGEKSVLGSLLRPRIISESTDIDGKANVDVFGDFNLSFEQCAPNAATRNPECKPGDVVGKASYYAVVDYPGLLGKHPPVRTGDVSTSFSWQGYKRVTVVETGAPDSRLVVAHLRDRDGFCDAQSFHNVLGVPVRFEIDSGEGLIRDVQGPPSSIGGNMRAAQGTTFDTLDDDKLAVNVDIAQPTISGDECQAYIKVTNTLPSSVNVLVHFPAQPPPVPADVRIVGLTCGAGGYATIQNLSAIPVSLAGFALRSLTSDAASPEEHLGLIGLLNPGQKLQISGDIDLNGGSGWQYGSTFAYGNVPNDYVRLVWGEAELSRRTCAGVQTDTPFPSQAPDGEGEIILDIIVPFGQQALMPLVSGWNLVSGTGTPTLISQALGANAQGVSAIYSWDTASGGWQRYLPGVPGNTGGLERFEPGRTYWVLARSAVTLSLTK